MVESAWSLLPPIITIVLALATKEVYMSLIVGIFVGALMFTGFDLLAAIDAFFAIMSDKVGGNVYILVFLVLLGIIVAAIARSGASRAYGEWAASVIKGKRSSLLVTSILGVVIFIDDYFNCLTVGTVMRPVTDKFNVNSCKNSLISLMLQQHQFVLSLQYPAGQQQLVLHFQKIVLLMVSLCSCRQFLLICMHGLLLSSCCS